MKEILDSLVKKYETPDFIKNDPIKFPHRYKNKKDVEIAAFISSLFAFGKRELFIKKLEYLFSHKTIPLKTIYQSNIICLKVLKAQLNQHFL